MNSFFGLIRGGILVCRTEIAVRPLAGCCPTQRAQASVAVHGFLHKWTMPTLLAEDEQGCRLWARCVDLRRIAPLVLTPTMECEVAHGAESAVAWRALEHMARRTNVRSTFVAPWTETGRSVDSSRHNATLRTRHLVGDRLCRCGKASHSCVQRCVRIIDVLRHANDLRRRNPWRRSRVILVLRRGEQRRLLKFV